MRVRAGVLTAVVAALCAVATASPALAASSESGPVVKASSTASATVIHAERFDPASGVVLATLDKTVVGAAGLAGGDMVDPIAAGPLAPGVKLTAAGMRAKSGLATSAVKTAAVPGCCSASGGWYISFSVRNGPSWAPNYVFHVSEQFCWGGGVAGVHWGYVFNCADAPGSATQPYTTSWFSNTAPVEHNPRVSSTNRFFYGWDQMNYSYNTAFYNGTQGAIDVCGGFCYFTRYPSIVVTVVANGGYYWTTSAG